MTRGPLMADLQGEQLLPEEVSFLRHPCLGGIILFARNYSSPEQLTALVAAIREVRDELVIAVDQEGGRVQRFREGFTAIPPMATLGKLYDEKGEAALESIHDMGWLMASEVLACGVDFSFAPVLDVDENFSSVIGDRSFSAEPEKVGLVAEAFIRGMREAGMPSVGKHFPGHGSVKEDSHVDTPVDKRPLSDIEAHDLVPFARLIEKGLLDGIMPAHVIYPELCDKPAVFSSFWIQEVLRKQLGFDGVVFSDDLMMEGATGIGSVHERAMVAMSAGCDMILVCNQQAEAIALLEQLTNESCIKDTYGAFRCAPAEMDTLAAIRGSARCQNLRDTGLLV